MTKIAVLLAGCGRFDGSEIHESVLTLLSIQQAGAKYQCFSLNENQHHVNNHLTEERVANETRNMMLESSRIARGNILDLANIDIIEYDGLIIPGGNGVASNLFTLAEDGEKFTVHPIVKKVANEFTKAGKPVGYICISPAMIPVVYDFPVKMTIGTDIGTAELVSKLGAIHQNCNVNEICIDNEHKIVSTPAYMLANSIAEAYSGISKLCMEIVKLT
ncbi:MAG: isoprenoid biosynthesis glyoxalase ElbB [Burkholderiales bacterium]|nr:isoprenoid biosynthesis glyoxalase ElbB [Burkholderiales bacterium]